MTTRLALLPGRERPLLFAHRGLSSEAPENTMAAFRLARDYGIPGIELDIHLTKDGKIVVIHDGNTKRTAPGSDVDVENEPYAAFSGLDIGSWKDARYSAERVALLSDVLEEFTPGMYFDVEIKAAKAADRGLEAALAALLSSMSLSADCIAVSSFNPVAIKRFKAYAPTIPTGIIYCDSKELPAYLRQGQGRWLGAADFLKPKYDMVKPLGMALKRGFAGRPVLPWTIDEPIEAARVRGLGCEGIISNKPHLVR
ncbi:MAG TPA: glycerophosphodiester phosphodiesterase [Spirochaetaceae bacterium]|jgi:glycerophosphoryl diester phosphodiesterase|nr:glycerophosphodiester phosphodiesterase [Spirochaetaceae bacterium]